MTDFNDKIIAEFRANDGVVQTAGFGASLVLLHTTGAKTGAERVSPVMAQPQPDGSWLVAASKAGAPENPAWYLNMLAHPDMAIEAVTGNGVETVEVVAEDLKGAARDAAWATFTEKAPGFLDYQVTAGDRLIPVVKLSRR
ncbi:nitroreductase/quinone reductase family protein [Subtercola endophyticus]|uniref:nitroreductase/quinone reductase family protein n=1 Tax=Subtercola endophyticus TaxID=2895559 RepID=UPI001E51C6CD|nr:nitroreductase/quinone reductase family protein [Subtercola endophyticus]UFS60426.1 nitroreductase family deazaflavin-dependent oxidoreductase [Subtercola endophyticus]